MFQITYFLVNGEEKMEIYFVTTNRKKVEEFNRILKGVIDLRHLKPDKPIPELESQDVEKVAKDKAKKASKIYNKTVLVEDTGLFINALNGLPGSLIDRETKKHGIGFKYWCDLLNRMNVSDRSAYVITTIAICFPEKFPIVYSGRVNGYISKKPMKGTHGFGFDSIFIPEGYSKTFSQLELEEKDKISMRRKALDKFLKDIKRISKMMV